MSKDTSFLNTGISSASSNAVKKQKAVQKEEKLKTLERLAPSTGVLLKLIIKEKENIDKLSSFSITPDTDLEAMKVDMLARRRYVELLDTLQSLLVKAERSIEAERKKAT